MLLAAKRNTEVPHEPAVDPDGSDVEGSCDVVGALDVLGPDGSREAVGNTVGSFDGSRNACIVTRVVKGNDANHRTKDLLHVAAGRGVESGDDRGGHVEPVFQVFGDRVRESSATGSNGPSFLLGKG